MSFDTLAPFPTPDEIVICNCDGDTRVPYERIKSYSDKEFELFIREWATTLTVFNVSIMIILLMYQI